MNEGLSRIKVVLISLLAPCCHTTLSSLALAPTFFTLSARVNPGGQANPSAIWEGDKWYLEPAFFHHNGIRFGSVQHGLLGWKRSTSGVGSKTWAASTAGADQNYSNLCSNPKKGSNSTRGTNSDRSATGGKWNSLWWMGRKNRFHTQESGAKVWTQQ